MKTADPPFLLMLNLHPAESNADILDRMRLAKDARERGTATNIVCVIDTFDDDPREIEDIPEARAFVRRLVALGFPAYLDLIPSADPRLNGALGAAELICMAAGKFPLPAGAVGPAMVDELNAGIANARRIATAALGPLVDRRGR
ncbi:MAG TPA: hypothetical protein VD866_12860 [Urbifossiella sp.]|nr:hypothetical protein [Urbifossiella sp.]